MATRRKNVKSEAAKPEAEEATGLPGMEADKDGEAATRKSGEETSEAPDDVAEADAAEDAVSDEVRASEEKADEGEMKPEENKSEGEALPKRDPKVHLPNLVCVRYYGAEPWTLREAVKMPYPELSPGDVVVTDRKTAKWLTRKGMPFQIVECGETLRVTSETADAEG